MKIVKKEKTFERKIGKGYEEDNKERKKI